MLEDYGPRGLMAPVDNISSLMTVGNENFKWTPEKGKELRANADDVSSWSMPVMKLRFLLCFLGALPLTWKKPCKLHFR